MQLRDYQQECVAKVDEAFAEFSKVLAVVPTGGGKCLGRGTPVRLNNGKVLPVEKIERGFHLAGPDIHPRIVKSVCTGTEMLYRVNHEDGSSYVVNESHILSLKVRGGIAPLRHQGKRFPIGSTLNIGVLDYLQQDHVFKAKTCGWRYGAPALSGKRAVSLVDIKSVEPIGEGDYFGFEIEGPDRLFLLGDFTVTHNTIIFSALTAQVHQRGGRVLIVAHREELLQQACTKLRNSTGLEAELERAGDHAQLTAPVVVASVQTLCRRYDQFPANQFALVIVDEAHHALATSYQGFLTYFLNGGAKVLGVTATPNTKGKKALGNFFETIAFEIGLIDLIRKGYLSPITVKSFPLKQVNLAQSAAASGKSLYTKGKDYDQDVVHEALEPYLEDVVSRLAPEIGQRKTIVFLPLIKTVQKFVELCHAHGITAAGVSGESEDRQAIIAGHGRDYQVLANSMLLTEGYDDPEIQAMMILRPTRSEILFSQMVGRGTRIHCPWGCHHRGSICGHAMRKRNLLLLDPLWLHEDMSLVKPARLVTGRDEDAKSITQKLEEAHEQIDLLEALASAEHERETKLAETLAKMTKRKASSISVEEWALEFHQPDLAEYEPTMKWHERKASPKQIGLLEKLGFDPDSIKNKGQASALLDSFFKRKDSGLASLKQIRLLRQFKHPNPDTATAAEAKAYITARLSEKSKAPVATSL